MGALAVTRPESVAAVADRERFTALISEHLDGLFRTALRLTRNRASAEDLLQETFLRAWRSFHTFQPGTNARAWLYRILMNAHIDAYRRTTREPEIVDQDDVDEFYLYSKVQESDEFKRAGNPEEALLSQLMDADVVGALEDLPETFRAVVVLADIEGFSYKEIAEILDIPIGTVMSRLHRGRRQLQVKLWDYARRARYVSTDAPNQSLRSAPGHRTPPPGSGPGR